MKNKLLYLTSVSLKRKLKTKWFLIANIFIFFVIVVIINIDSVISLFGGDFNKKSKIYIVDNTGNTFDILKEEIEKSKENVQSLNYYTIEKYESENDAKKKLGNQDLVFVINNSKEKLIDVKLTSNGYLDTVEFEIFKNILNQTKIRLATNYLNITDDEYNLLFGDVDLKREILDESKSANEEITQIVATSVFPILLLPIFMLILFLVQMIGAEINDEKTTKAMEIIISNVSAKTHFFSKILAGNFFVIIQGSLLLFYLLIGFIVKKYVSGIDTFHGFSIEAKQMINGLKETGFISQLNYIIPLGVILLLLTFLGYSLLAGILASVTTNNEDYQQLQTPIMIISLMGYYLSIMAGVFKGSKFITFLSLCPLISAILSPSLLVIGQINVIHVIISIIIMLIVDYLFIKYGLIIYKDGILNYSSKNLWGKIIKSLSKK